MSDTLKQFVIDPDSGNNAPFLILHPAKMHSQGGRSREYFGVEFNEEGDALRIVNTLNALLSEIQQLRDERDELKKYVGQPFEVMRQENIYLRTRNDKMVVATKNFLESLSMVFGYNEQLGVGGFEFNGEPNNILQSLKALEQALSDNTDVTPIKK